LLIQNPPMESSPILVPGSGYVPDAPSAATTLANTAGAEGEVLTFGDMLEAINPLQHLPVVGTIYREVTGDEIKTLPRLIGGAIFGGIFGLIGAAVESVIKEASGATIGEHLLHAVGLGQDHKAPEVRVTDLSTGQEVPEDAAAGAGNAIVLPGAVVPTSSIMLDEASGKPTSFERGPVLPAIAGTSTAPVQRALAQPAASESAGTAGAASPAATQPTEFFRSLQRANFAHRAARPLSTLSQIETTAPRKTRTTAAGATAANAVAEPVPTAPDNVGAPIAILPQPQAGSGQPPAATDAAAAAMANPEAFPAAMMAALDKYQALRRADAAQQLSVTH
jgi:hypothetical protein